MADRAVQHNTVTCDAAISACKKECQWQMALELLAAMADRAVLRHTITCNAAHSLQEGRPMAACHGATCFDGRESNATAHEHMRRSDERLRKDYQWQLALDLVDAMSDSSATGSHSSTL